MKAFLMFRDHDFDPAQIIALRESNAWEKERDGKLNLKQLLPWNSEALMQDLGLGTLINHMSLGDNVIAEVAEVTLLSATSDRDTIMYRQKILKDCIQNETAARELYQLTAEINEKIKNRRWWGLYSSPSGTLYEALEKLQMFTEMLKKLRDIALNNEKAFDSEGFNKLFTMIRQELSDEYFGKIEDHLRRLQFKDGTLISAQLGYGIKGTNYILRKPHPDNRRWLERIIPLKQEGFTYQLHPRDEAGARALSELQNQGINNASNVIAQAADHILSFFQALRTELAFYIGGLNLQRHLKELQEPVCFPYPLDRSQNDISFSGLYDVGLALNTGRKVISNELDDRGKNIIIITGANTGGKSTFLRSIGIAQLMMQSGMFAPAEKFASGICSSVITHFRRGEDTAMESGKLDEELSRMDEIVGKLTPGSMVLFNESFAATNEREGSEIAREITLALSESRTRVVFVTHLYEFAHEISSSNAGRAIFLKAERLENGTRTFRIVEGEPLQTSYGEDLYNTIFQN
ncbi:MAG TPA: hypothetical protein VHO03_20205 [Ignavibacteriales bacterium]|nr:hypothetical protein [Ignavibacteriales bacterium]